jgi:hypothetical protein
MVSFVIHPVGKSKLQFPKECEIESDQTALNQYLGVECKFLNNPKGETSNF